ncbi:MAG: Ig-like domain-containing protein [Eubacteriales bacterium]
MEAKVEWKSDNEAVVSVTADGLITAKSVGTATVSAAYSEDGGDVATVAVTVYRPVIELGGATYDVSEEKPDLALVGAEAAFSEVLGIYDITSEKTEITFEDAEGGVKLVSSSMKMGERRYSVVLAGVEYRFDALVQICTAEEFKNSGVISVSATVTRYFVPERISVSGAI